MSDVLTDRLNQILPRITSKEFLAREGIGNEIACYIFDYPAADELRVRAHTQMIVERLASHHSTLRVLHLDLLRVMLAYLEQRGLLAKALAMQAAKGDSAMLHALKGPLAAEKVCEFVAREHQLNQHDLVLLSGVGSVWPILRAHSLLNCLHKVIDTTPLLMFYPGTFDGKTLRLFGRIAGGATNQGAKPYYRAFILVPGGTNS